VHKFFRRSPWDVANGLAGKTLKVGDKEGTITRVKPQYPADNANWTDRPLFGPHPVDAYVAPYRGAHLLFLRTGTPGTNTCVRIDGIEIGEQACSTPSQVCKALGIDSERTGKVSFSQNVVSLSWS
jgi:3-methyladenine DNA glycosylase Mpg